MNKEIKRIRLDTDLTDREREALEAYAEFLKNRKLEKIFNCFLIILIILLAFSISFFIYLKLNNNNNNTYSLNGESTNFIYDNSVFTEKLNKYFILYGNLKIKNETITYDDIRSFSLECGDKLIIRSSKILRGYNFERKGYNEMFPKDVVDKIQTDWNIKITYELNGEKKEEIIELTATKE